MVSRTARDRFFVSRLLLHANATVEFMFRHAEEGAAAARRRPLPAWAG
jgi:hypothetical protein